jgi:hypothetical protein
LTELADGTRPADDGESAYNFVAWFYKDAQGKEHAFTADLPVKSDLKLYPKWSSDRQVPYTVYYKLNDGTDTDVAEASVYYAQPGTTQTVNAKTDDELYADYKGNVELPSDETATISVTPDGENTYTFWYTRKTASLTITKNVDADTKDTFIFDVKQGNKLITTVTITGEGSVKVAGLNVGETYTVTEKTDWSWRYNATYGNGGSVTISSDSSGNSITITNEKERTGWLSSAAAVVNRWSGKGSTVTSVELKNGGDA